MKTRLWAALAVCLMVMAAAFGAAAETAAGDGLTVELCDPALWTPAYYSGAAGERRDSKVMLSNAADTFLPESWQRIAVDAAEEQSLGIRLHGWDADGTYAGIWDPQAQAWGTSLARSSLPESVDLDAIRALFPGYRFKISFTGRKSDFPMTAEEHGASIHVWDRRASAQPGDPDWDWTVGTLDRETGLPGASSGRLRSGFIPVGAGTQLVFDADGYQGMWVFEYDPEWTMRTPAAMTTWSNRYTVRHDGYIRVLLRLAGNADITDAGALETLLSCPCFVAPDFEENGAFSRLDWVMSDLEGGEVTGNDGRSLATRSIHYAEENVLVDADPEHYHVTAAVYGPDGAFLRQSGSSTAGMLCVPKGLYYRLSIRAIGSDRAAPSLAEHYEIREGDDLFWYGSMSTPGEVGVYPRTDTIVTPEIRFSGRGLTVRCTDPAYQIHFIGYDSDDPYGGHKRIYGAGSAAYIDPETWYRLIVKREDAGNISIPEAEAQLIWEREEDVCAGIAAEGAAALRLAETGDIPDWYAGHIAERAEAINALRSDTTVQFAFITDYHINEYGENGGQAGHSGALLRYLAENTEVDLCFYGGDAATGLPEWSGDEADRERFRELLARTCAILTPSGMTTCFIAGNHDGGISGVDYGQLLSAEELYRVSGLQALRERVTVDQACPLQYYWDDSAHNVRYIVAALGLKDTVTPQPDSDLFKFLAAALRSAPAGSKIVIFNHIILGYRTHEPAARTVMLAQLADAYNARQVDFMLDGLEGTASDFSAATGEVVAIIGSHGHYDHSFETDGGIPVIMTTTDNAGGAYDAETLELSPRPLGGIDEQAFDVFTIDTATGAIHATRIGAGGDRSWN